VTSFINFVNHHHPMKPQPLPFKRRPVPKGLLTRLSAVTRKRQRVAATANPEEMLEDGASKISRNLTIIFLVHIVAIGLWFTHENFFAVSSTDPVVETKVEAAPAPAAQSPATPPPSATRLSSNEHGYVVRRGDNYETIAAAHGVPEAELREANGHRRVVSGMLMRIPPRRIVAADPPEVVAIRESQPTTAPVTQPAPVDDGLVDAVPVGSTPAPRAVVIRPNVDRSADVATEPAPATPSGQTYVVQPGDSVWRIANRFKVGQDELMRANNISDPRKMKTGMTLVIP
jgi:LysM repeat protein